jgi:hypothetical protein
VLWWIRFKNYTKAQRFSQALAATQETIFQSCKKDTDKLDQSDVRNKKVIEAINRNERALFNLAVASTTAKAMVHFHKAATTE